MFWSCFGLFHLYVSIWCVKEFLFYIYIYFFLVHILIIIDWLHVHVSVLCVNTYTNTGAISLLVFQNCIFPLFYFILFYFFCLFLLIFVFIYKGAVQWSKVSKSLFLFLWFAIPVELDCDDLLVISVPPHASSLIYVLLFVHFLSVYYSHEINHDLIW